MTNSALVVTTLLLVTACEKAPAKQSRLFTDDELATLETRVLAEVNKSRRDCIRPEALASGVCATEQTRSPNARTMELR